ncbi:MAG: hypothetical protein ACRERC_26675 [Candidatus Binatia bacterium]
MQRVGRWILGTVVVALGVVGWVPRGSADIRSDQAAAIVMYPLIQAFDLDFVILEAVGDTIIQLSNTSTQPAAAHCFYENANAHCSNTGAVCTRAIECCEGDGCGICAPGWNEIDFHVRITPRQPLGWSATHGMQGFGSDFGKFKLDGVVLQGIGGSSNATSSIPPLPESPFIGSLTCVAVDEITGVPVDRNVLKGEATQEVRAADFGATVSFDVHKHNAVGIQAIAGAVNDDRELILGGVDAEYNGCPSHLIVNHVFDRGQNPVSGEPATTRVALVPCAQNLRTQVPGSAVVQYLVYNEFEQRFSTSKTVECQQYQPLSTIDTTQPERSIFSAGVAGTLYGQSRLNPLGSGLLGIAVEGYGLATDSVAGGVAMHSASTNLHYQGDRVAADVIALP